MNKKKITILLVVFFISETIKALKKSFSTPIRTYPLGEYSERVPHYVGKRNYGREKRYELIKDLKSNDISSKDTVKIVCGECSDGIRKFAEKAAEKGLNVELISGPTLKEDVEKEINEMKEKFHINFFKANIRPRDHGVLFRKNMYLEEPHDEGGIYETAMVVKNARDDVIASFERHFNDLKRNSTKT